MNETDLQNKLDFITGSLMATQAALRGLIMSLPDREKSLATVLGQIDLISAVANGKGLSDSMIEGMDRARFLIQPRQ